MTRKKKLNSDVALSFEAVACLSSFYFLAFINFGTFPFLFQDTSSWPYMYLTVYQPARCSLNTDASLGISLGSSDVCHNVSGFKGDLLVKQGFKAQTLFILMYFFTGMFTYNEKSRTYWFSKTCMDNDSEFNLVGVVSFETCVHGCCYTYKYVSKLSLSQWLRAVFK